jgi:MFS family permease
MGPRVGPLAFRVGLGKLVIAGMALFVPGYLLALRFGEVPHYAALLPVIVLLGLGFGLAFPTLNIAATNGVKDEEQGLASGLLSTSFQLGGAIVLAIVTAVISGGAAGQKATLHDLHPGFDVVALMSLFGVAVAIVGFAPIGRRVKAVVEELAHPEPELEVEAA